MNLNTEISMCQAGTGFMSSLAETIQRMEAEGYDESMRAEYDHFECCSGRIKLFAADFSVDQMFRFENTSDPDDQAIAYAITSDVYDIKGIYVDSYGLYHDALSHGMILKLLSCPTSDMK